MRILALVLTALPLAALDNKIVIRDVEGSGHTGLPITVLVTGAVGDFTGFPRPAITTYTSGGSEQDARAVATYWQSDVKTRHRNGSTTYTVSSVANRSHTTCSTTAHCEPSMYVTITTSAAHGVYSGEQVTISGSSTTEINGTWRVADRTDTTMELAGVNSVASPGATNGTVTAPDYGDWATGMVTFYVDIPAGGRAEVDFVNDSNPSHSGNQAATDAAALTRAQLSARSWTAEITVGAPVASGNSATLTVDARDILDDATNAPSSDCGVKAWLKGPLVTEYIIQSRCAEPGYFDVGFEAIQTANTISGSGLNNTTQSDGTQTFDVGLAMTGLEASVGTPLLAQVGTGGAKIRQFIWICGISGTTLTVCDQGRGAHGTTVYAVASGADIFFLQYKDAASGWKHLSPEFHIRAYTTGAGADYGPERIRFVVNNNSSGAGVTGYYSVSMATTSGTRYASSTYRWVPQGVRESKVFWDGTSPEHYCAGGSGQDPCGSGTRALRYRVEHNIPWWIHSGIIPSWRSDDVDNAVLTAHVDLYNSSDKGDLESSMANYKYWSGGCTAFDSTIKTLGGAQYAQGKYLQTSTCGSMSTDDETRAEPWFEYRDVADMLVASGQADSRPWEHFFGTSIAGGAGMAEAENHLNLVHWVGTDSTLDSGAFTTAACSSCTGYGRVISLDRRHNIYIGSGPWMSQGSSKIEQTSGTDTDSPFHGERPRALPIGATTLDQAHRAPVAKAAYLLTGEYYYLRGIQAWAAWNLLYRNQANAGTLGSAIPSSTTRRLNWSVGDVSRDLLRQTSWPMLALFNANLFSPNVAQFGNSYTPPESHYFRRAMVRQIRAQEGIYALSSTAKFTPRNATCSDITYSDSGSPIPANTSDIYCYGRQYAATARDLPVLMNRGGASGTCSGCEAGKSSRYESAYNHFGMLGVFGFIGQHDDFDFVRGVRDRIAKTVYTGVRNIDFGPYLLTYFHLPVIPTATGYSFTGRDGTVNVDANETAATWEIVRDALTTENPSYWTSSTVVEDISYPQYLRASLATVYGTYLRDGSSYGCAERTGGCTAEGAYDRVASILAGPDLASLGRRVTIRPLDQLQNLTITPAATSVTVTFRNPARIHTGAPGRVSVSASAFGAQDDSGDTAMTCKANTCTATVSGLTSATAYNVRVSAGTARYVSTFTTE